MLPDCPSSSHSSTRGGTQPSRRRGRQRLDADEREAGGPACAEVGARSARHAALAGAGGWRASHGMARRGERARLGSRERGASVKGVWRVAHALAVLAPRSKVSIVVHWHARQSVRGDKGTMGCGANEGIRHPHWRPLPPVAYAAEGPCPVRRSASSLYPSIVASFPWRNQSPWLCHIGELMITPRG